MKHVRLRITADGDEAAIHPMWDVLTNADFVDYATAIQWNFTGDETGMLHYVEGDRAAFDAAVDASPAVIDHEVEPAGEGAFYAFVRGAATPGIRELWSVTVERPLVAVPPVEWHRDGTVTFSMLGPADVIQASLDAVPDPVSVTVEEISGLRAMPQTAGSVLTGRQREAVEAAIDAGYYDVPRSGSQEDVAGRLDCAPSTAAEHLRKAEARVLRSLFG